MNNVFILLTLVINSTTALAQFSKPVSLRGSTNANIVIDGIGINDAGFGLSFDASFFAKHTIQLLIETNADRFIGDKSLFENPQGRENKGSVIYSLTAGIQFFLIPRLAISLTYGPSFHSIKAIGFSTNNGSRFGMTGFFGKERRLMPKIYFVNVPTDQVTIRYCGFGFGYRIH